MFDFLRRRTEGVIEAIYVTGAAGEPMQAAEEGVAVAGRGLEGDRYYRGTGHWQVIEACQLTLIEAEALERIARRTGLHLLAGEHRRNVVTRGVKLARLEGRRFRLGEALVAYERPRPPCGHLERLTERGIARALAGESGICARVVEGGRIGRGDRLVEAAGREAG